MFSAKDRYSYLYKLIDYKHEEEIPVFKSDKTSLNIPKETSNLVDEVAYEFYDNRNPSCYLDEDKERGSNIIRFINNTISETTQELRVTKNS